MNPEKDRLASLNWQTIEHSLWTHGYAKTPPVLTPKECAALIALYPDKTRFRSRTIMERHRFGVGEYKYFANPLPQLVQELRSHFYPPLAVIANQWMEALRLPDRFPADLTTFLTHCHQQGQTRPTPLLLRYEQEGYNCLHQDLYGEVVFPLQLTCFLNQPGKDYTGGEFLLVEQQPRAQSRGAAILPQQGEIIIFTTRFRPAQGKRGYYRAQMRHGVSRITSGSRHTLGIIFHDAQ
ncbi:MAG: 2OG-Fe(II) oxygenase [Candidatus Binatia bacterium]